MEQDGTSMDGFIAASLTLTAVVSYGSGLAHRKEGHVDDAIVKTGLYGAIPGAVAGVFIVSIIGEHLDNVFKLLSLVMITWAIRKSVKKMKSVDSEGQGEIIGRNEQVETVPLRLGAAVGGMLSSVLAIGAGVNLCPPSFAPLATLHLARRSGAVYTS